MKILIVSDIHGNYQNMKKVLKDNSSFDYLFLLGDILSGPQIEGYDKEELSRLLNQFQKKIIYVRGNCDHSSVDLLSFFMDQLYFSIPIDHKIFFLTHGHYYNPSFLPDLPFDIFLSGHTHVAMLERKNDTLYYHYSS